MFCKVRQVKAFMAGAAAGAMMMSAGYMAAHPQMRRMLRKKGRKMAAVLGSWCEDMF